MPPLRVPPRYRAGLASVTRLTEDDVVAIRAALDVLGDDVSFRALADRTDGQITPGINVLRVFEAVASLIGLLPESGDGADRLARDLSQAETLEIDDTDREAFAERLAALMSIPALAVASRALDVMVDHDKVFHDARILTDVRPVFESDVSKGVKAAGVTACLKMEYHPHGDSSIDSVFVSMDRGDLEHLQRIVRRALDKMDSLQSLLQESHIPTWNFDSHTHGAS